MDPPMSALVVHNSFHSDRTCNSSQFIGLGMPIAGRGVEIHKKSNIGTPLKNQGLYFPRPIVSKLKPSFCPLLGRRSTFATEVDKFVVVKLRASEFTSSELCLSIVQVFIPRVFHYSSIGSRPGRRMPSSRNFSCKLCRCNPIVAAVRETFQR